MSVKLIICGRSFLEFIMQHPFYSVYAAFSNLPRKKYHNIASAIIDAGDVAKKNNIDTFVIEYMDAPCVVCCCSPDGSLEQL